MTKDTANRPVSKTRAAASPPASGATATTRARSTTSASSAATRTGKGTGRPARAGPSRRGSRLTHPFAPLRPRRNFHGLASPLYCWRPWRISTAAGRGLSAPSASR
jgi:hypothetical protein